MRRGAAIVGLCVLVVLGAAAVRAVWAGGGALADGDAALTRGDTALAIAHWRRAARWYVPLVGPSAGAFARLERVATEAERAGDPATALAGWQAVRSAAVAIRGATAPFDDHRVRADARIAALLGAQPNPGAGATPEARTAWHARVLDGTTRPTRGWLVAALAGLAGLLGGGAVTASAWRRGRRPDAGRLRRGLVLSAAGITLWLAGLLLA